jgi:phage terminase small subunit
MGLKSVLNARQQRFVEEYLLDLNATQAAIRAGYSSRTAGQIGEKLLKKVEIRSAVLAGKIERSERTKVDAAWLLRRLVDEADADAGDLFDDSGALLPIKQWPPIWRKGLITAVDVEHDHVDGKVVGSVAKIRMVDRSRRLDMIGKHVDVQAFRELLGLGSPSGGPVEVDATISAAEAYRIAKER